MDQLRSYFYFFLFLIRLKQSFQFNNGYTDPLTLEEYEEDVELIKIRFDTTRPCRFFSDKRYPKVEKGLANCSWYEDDACCKRTEVASVFESMYTLHQASVHCRHVMNYLMCFFCAPDQYLWYVKRRVKVCQSFCDEVFKHCKSAEFNGKIIGKNYDSGVEFCEANYFQVVQNDCFAFDESVFSSAPQKSKSEILCSVLVVLFFSILVAKRI